MEKRTVHVDRNLQDPHIHDLLHPKEVPADSIPYKWPEPWWKKLFKRKDRQRKS